MASRLRYRLEMLAASLWLFCPATTFATQPPHKVNYRANIYALFKMGVKRILATNAVGAINANLNSGNLVLPHDFVIFTKLRNPSFYDNAPVTHVDMSQLFCPEI
jgi:5'-methylthioadenosine phosphorylase